jgi:hypothetical protein
MAFSAALHTPHHGAADGHHRPASDFGRADAADQAALYLQVHESSSVCFGGSMSPPRMGGRDECAKYLQVTSNAIWHGDCALQEHNGHPRHVVVRTSGSDLVAEPSNEQLAHSDSHSFCPRRRSSGPEQAREDWSYYLRTWGIFEQGSEDGSEDGPARGPTRGPNQLGTAMSQASAEGKKKTQEFVHVLA